ncbi:unnamed protein product [Sphagnum jensenii]|uniref:Uncharacterized protein n=1 Tax=Sphagnum jensenii TaxID=128206 RepID=A0ABP0V9L1_9BRYO
MTDAINTSKVAHVVNNSGRIITRRLYNPAIVATQVNPRRYDPERDFMKHETSPFFEHFLGIEPYVQITARAFGTEDQEQVMGWMTNFARNGFKLRRPDGNLQLYKFLYGSWVDKGIMYAVEAESPINSLDDLGIHVTDVQRAPKYFKRIAAHYEYACFGTVNQVQETDFGQLIYFELDNGYQGVHANYDLDKMPSAQHKACADGIGLISTGFLREQLKVQDRNLSTYGGKWTVFDPAGTGKGYVHAKDDLAYDMVTYDAKKALVFDEFFVGILGALKPGLDFYSDLQSMANFELYEYAHAEAQNTMKEFIESLKNPDSVKGWILSKLSSYQDNNSLILNAMDNSVPDDNKSATEEWMLITALQGGVDIFTEPALFRRVCGHLLPRVLNCEKGRIPYDRLGVRCDICPDPAMFDSWGMVHPENSIIPEGTCVAIDVPEGPVVTYRQPNGMALEHSQSVNFHMRQFQKFGGRRRIFFGRDLLTILAPMNGADLDDTACVIHDPAAVKHIRGLDYPVTEKMIVAPAKKRSVGRYYDGLKKTVVGIVGASYTAEDFIQSMQVARSMSVKLGSVVNDIMLDTLLSGKHKLNMMKYLANMIQAEPDKERKIWLLDRREWLANREDYQLRYVATNLEAVIDYCVAGKGSSAQFDPLVKLCGEMRASTQVFPMIFAKEGTGFMGQGRISSKKKLGIDYALAPSLLCQALMTVTEEREQFIADLKQFEWDCITFVPTALEEMFGADRTLTQIARDMRSWWTERIAVAMSIQQPKLRQEAYNRALYGNFHKCIMSGEGKCPTNCPNKGKLLDPGLKQMMEEHDYETRLFLAVEMKRIVHHNADPSRAVDDTTGALRGVPDGIFGNNVMYNYYLAALEEAGLTGKYVQVDLDEISIHGRIKDKTMQVIVNNDKVLRKSDDYFLGLVTEDVADGEYKMVNGMLEIREPSPEIRQQMTFAEMIENGEYMPYAKEVEDSQ